jgi:hypothetical protein
MPLRLDTAPTLEPLTLADVRRHLKIDTGNQEPAPDAITVALMVATPGNVDDGAHRYLATFVTADGETQAGTVSAPVTVVDKAIAGQVTLTGIPLGGSAVTARKLYRTEAAGSTYMLLATLSNNTATTYTDNIADGSLGAGAPSANTTGDPELTRMVKATRSVAEKRLRRALVTQSWTMLIDNFPGHGIWPTGWDWIDGLGWCVVGYTGRLGREQAIEFPFPPLQTVESVSYVDTAGVTQTLVEDTDYTVDAASEPGRIVPCFGKFWPQTRAQVNAVTIAFTCGYGAPAAVPDRFKQWMLLRIGTMDRNREDVVVDPRVASVDLGYVDSLLDDERLFSF